MQHKLPLPPFGLVVEAYQREGVTLKFPIYLYVGKDAFKEAKLNKSYGSLCMCIPPDKSPNEFRYPVKGQHVVIVDTGGTPIQTLRKLIVLMLQNEARVACFFSDEFENEYYVNPKKD